ncbi:MAG TPA: AAA family ATPase, partial [Campylobacterales bacterium]|nr:AAA family ATPase [Campylobacterales bacterium]
LTDPSDRTSKTYEKAYLYVDTKNAKDKAEFVKFLIDKGRLQKEYITILDLTFGSGNLTSHIVLDNDIEYEKLIFNDKNREKTNQKIIENIDSSEVWNRDILNKDEFFDVRADLVIVNPQIGGSYIDGDILKQGESKSDVFNNLAKTLESFLEKDATILYYGKEKDLKEILPDVKYIKYSSKLIDLFVFSNEIEKVECFEKSGNEFVECKEKKEDVEIIESLDEIIGDIEEIVSNDDGIEIKPKEKEKTDQQQEQDKCKFSTEEKGSLDFKYKNILFKGVPGTGKSRIVNQIIENKLKLKLLSENILRINVHSASSNADLMQGIGISSSNNGQISYEEKQGLIMDLIQKSTFAPRQPFVLVLEEVQENSLNELIGDLIYLIEDEKRSNLFDFADNKEYSYQELVDRLVDEGNIEHYVKIPYLVSSKTEYRKMILPNNLYVFCTSNYRDDKKVIEDNLLRRFEVVEIYPQYERGFKDINVAKFLEEFNRVVLEVFEYEIHPDRFQIGHANWLYVDNEKGFYKALLKAVIEFKEIREIEYSQGLKKIFEKIKLEDGWVKDAFYELKLDEKNSYEKIINELQKKVYDEILVEQNAKSE